MKNDPESSTQTERIIQLISMFHYHKKQNLKAYKTFPNINIKTEMSLTLKGLGGGVGGGQCDPLPL